MSALALHNVAEIDLVYRNKVKASLRPCVKKSKEAYQLLLDTWEADKIELVEQFKVILLNRASRVLGIYQHSSGSMHSTSVDCTLLLCAAIKSGATGMILAHNHPTGNLRPSRADEAVTAHVKAAATLIGFTVIDHIIVTTEEYFSFAENGLL